MRLLAGLIWLMLSVPSFGAVAFDAFSSSGNNQTGNISWTHTPVGTPRGIIVLVPQAGVASPPGTDEVASVTYGGVAMTEVALSPLIGGTSPSTEGQVAHVFYLGSSIPTGAQTVEVTVSGSVPKRGSAISLTAGADTEVVDTSTININDPGEVTGTLSLAGRTCFCAELFMADAGSASSVTPLTGWTGQLEHTLDSNRTGVGHYTYDTIGSSDVTFGGTYSSGGNHGLICLAVAVSEVSSLNIAAVKSNARMLFGD